jgi:hypothetical protein
MSISSITEESTSKAANDARVMRSKTMPTLKSYYRNRIIAATEHRNVVADWDAHLERMPKSDMVDDYVHGPEAEYNIPFMEELFSAPLCQAATSGEAIPALISKKRSAASAFSGVAIQVTTNTTNSVNHAGNSSSVAPRLILENSYEEAFAPTSAIDRATRFANLEATETNKKQLLQIVDNINSGLGGDSKKKPIAKSGTKTDIIKRIKVYYNAEAAVQESSSSARVGL